MRFVTKFVDNQTRALDVHYNGNRVDGYVAKLLAYAAMCCIAILSATFVFFSLANSEILELPTRLIFLPLIAFTAVFFVVTYRKLLTGELETARLYFSTAFVMFPVISVLLTGGFPVSDASSLLILPPIVIILLYGMHKGIIFSLILPIAAVGQWALFAKFGNPFPDFTSASSPLANYLIVQAAIYSVAICVIAAFQHQKHFLRVELEKIATHDDLTGLRNRLNFQEQLELACKNARNDQSKFAVFYLDLDHFKPINDQYGHKVGDSVLQKVAARMRQCVDKGDILARVGGDEFAILKFNAISTEELIKFEYQVRREINFPISAEKHLLQVGVSIGSSVYPDTTSNIQSLVDAADQAMYRNKAEIRNGINIDISVQTDEDLITVDTLYYKKSA